MKWLKGPVWIWRSVFYWFQCLLSSFSSLAIIQQSKVNLSSCFPIHQVLIDWNYWYFHSISSIYCDKNLRRCQKKKMIKLIIWAKQFLISQFASKVSTCFWSNFLSDSLLFLTDTSIGHTYGKKTFTLSPAKSANSSLEEIESILHQKISAD